jgi:hypothetical protein
MKKYLLPVILFSLIHFLHADEPPLKGHAYLLKVVRGAQEVDSCSKFIGCAVDNVNAVKLKGVIRIGTYGVKYCGQAPDGAPVPLNFNYEPHSGVRKLSGFPAVFDAMIKLHKSKPICHSVSTVPDKSIRFTLTQYEPFFAGYNNPISGLRGEACTGGKFITPPDADYGEDQVLFRYDLNNSTDPGTKPYFIGRETPEGDYAAISDFLSANCSNVLHN